MQLENTFTVPVPVDDAWRVLLDVERVAPCMPGASLDEMEGDTFHGRVKVKVGPITVTYKGTASFVEKDDAAHRAVIEASGKEQRGSGTAKATVTTTLHPQGDATEVKVVTDLNVTGKPAQFGRGVMADVSAKLVEQFAQHLSEEIQHGGAAAAPAAEAPAPAAAEAAEGAAAAPTPAPAAAPVEAAPAPPTPLPSTPPGAGQRVTDAAAPTAGTPSAGVQPPRRSAEAIDLMETAGMPVLKRVAPAAGLAALVLLVVWLVRRRRG